MLFLPKGWNKEYKEGEAFQASHQHQERADDLGCCGEPGIAAKAAAEAQSGTIAGNAGDDGSDGLCGVDAAEHEQQDAYEDGDNIHHKDDHHVGDNVG